MIAETTCATCGMPITKDVLGGNCSACLRRVALAEQTLPEDTVTVARSSQEANSPAHPGTSGNFDDYEIIAPIARGGMGVVYRARQRRLKREVALKMVLNGPFANAEELRRFRVEAEAVARLNHPNIVPVYDVGEQNGRPWYSMRFIEAGTLAQRLKDTPDGKLAARDAAALLVKITRAVHYAHQRGLLHRDLKPANILLDAQGEPHITDFGLAKEIESEGHTMTGAVLGTLAYMAPEQAAGRTRDLTTAVDVFAIGAILYHLLTSRPPFEEGSVVEVIKCEPARPKTRGAPIDRDLETICMRCLQKDPSARYGSAEALADDLERWLGGEPIQARTIGNVERAWLWMRRNPALAVVSCISVLALTAAFAALLWGLERSRRETKNVTAARDQIIIARDEMATSRAILAIARNESQQQLRDALLDRATSGRIAALSGWRDSGLKALRLAAAIRTGMDLRSEAIAHLAGFDMVLTTQRDRSRPGIRSDAGASAGFDLFASFSSTKQELVFTDATSTPVGSPVKITFPARLDNQRYGVRVFFDPTTRRLALQRMRGGPAIHGDVVLIDVAGRTVLRQWEGGDFGGFTQDGELFAIQFDGSEIGIFGAVDGAEVGRVQSSAGQANFEQCAIHPQSGSSLLAFAVGSTVEIWNWRENRMLGRRPFSSVLGHLAWSGDVLATMARGGLTQGELWNVRSGHTRAFSGEGSNVYGLYFTPDGSVLTAVGVLGAGQTTHFDGITGQRILDSPSIIPTAYAGDGRRFLNTSSEDGHLGEFQRSEALTVWDATSVFRAAKFMDISPDGRWIVLVGQVSDRAVTKVIVLESATRKVVANTDLWLDGNLAFLADSKHLVGKELPDPKLNDTTEWQWWVFGLEMADGRIELKRRRPLAPEYTTGLHRSTLSPDRRWVALHGPNKFAVAEPLFEGPRRHLELLAQSASGASVFMAISNAAAYTRKSSGAGGTEHGLNPRSENEIGRVLPINALFSPDGRLAFSIRANRFSIHETNTWTALCDFPAKRNFSDMVPTAAWSPDSRFIASAQGRSTVTVVDAEKKEIVASLVSPRRGGIQNLQFMPDGRTLVALRQGGALEFWDLTKLSTELAALGMPWDLPPPTVVPAPGIAGPVKPEELPPLSSIPVQVQNLDR